MKKYLLAFLFSTFACTAIAQQTNPYEPLPLGAVQPRGWLYQQLLTMKQGSTGHLDEYYRKLQNDNGWLGGKGDSWEETPYWLDGAVPLAYMLQDDTLRQKVLRYINWTLDHQRPSGFFGPYTKNELAGKQTADDCGNGEDWWQRMIMLKVLQQYYTATKDPRVIPFMDKYFRYQLRSLRQCPLSKWTEWATSRGGDNILVAGWLYHITKAPYLKELATLLYQQTMPWTHLFGARNWVMAAAAQQNDEHWMNRHGVNVGMGLKLPAAYYQFTRKQAYLDSLQTGIRDIMTLHGLPHGMFSADEDLHGNEPSQGVELCATVESMFSLEEILSISGDQRYADAIERMAFNALPGQITEDFISRQYFMMANQVQITRGVFHFSLPFGRGMNNVFGPYAGYTCCTANMHQGWTKFTRNLWYSTPSGGLAALLYSPSSVTTEIGGKKVQIEEETRYPFGDSITFTFRMSGTVSFPLELRVPGWCREASIWVNGAKQPAAKAGQLIRLNRNWKDNDRVVLHLPMEITTSNWARNSRAVERGPLVYALKIEEAWKMDSIPQEGRYYEARPQSDWNYGLPRTLITAPAQHLQLITKPFDPQKVWTAAHAPLEIIAEGRKIPGWKLVEGVAVLPVTTRENIYQGVVEKATERITLIPYGSAKLRIVAFPVVP